MSCTFVLVEIGRRHGRLKFLLGQWRIFFCFLWRQKLNFFGLSYCSRKIFSPSLFWLNLAKKSKLFSSWNFIQISPSLFPPQFNHNKEPRRRKKKKIPISANKKTENKFGANIKFEFLCFWLYGLWIAQTNTEKRTIIWLNKAFNF